MAALSIEQVLAEEAKEIHGDDAKTKWLADNAKKQTAQDKRTHLNEDRHGRADPTDDDLKPRDKSGGFRNLKTPAEAATTSPPANPRHQLDDQGTAHAVDDAAGALRESPPASEAMFGARCGRTRPSAGADFNFCSAFIRRGRAMRSRMYARTRHFALAQAAALFASSFRIDLNRVGNLIVIVGRV